MSHNFEMKDLGQLNYFLGLEVNSGSDGYYLSQAKYASEFLFKAGLTDSKHALLLLNLMLSFLLLMVNLLQILLCIDNWSVVSSISPLPAQTFPTMFTWLASL